MKGFLIDTNVLSEYSRTSGPDPNVKRWLETTTQESQYVSVITLAEIEKGIVLLAEGKRKRQLEQWLRNDLEEWFTGRILSVDRSVSRQWALLVANSARLGRPLPIMDSLIAATVVCHDLKIATRNARDFEVAGLSTFNPWSDKPMGA